MVNDLFSCVDSKSVLSQEQRDAKKDDNRLVFRYCKMDDMVVCSKYINLLCEKSPDLNFAQIVNNDSLAIFDIDENKEVDAPQDNNAYRFQLRLENFLVKIKKNTEDGVKFVIMNVD